MIEQLLPYIVIIIIFTFLLSSILTSRQRLYKAYRKYMNIGNKKRMTGKDFAFEAKKNLNLTQLKFAKADGVLVDAYNIKHKTLILSEDVCNTSSISSITIVAHELGHAVQDKNGSILLRLTSVLKTLTKISNLFILPLLVGGTIAYGLGIDRALGMNLFYWAIILFMLHLLNNLLQIPLEINASKIALKYLKKYKYISNRDLPKAKKLLSIASQTYMAGFLDGLLIFRFKKR